MDQTNTSIRAVCIVEQSVTRYAPKIVPEHVTSLSVRTAFFAFVWTQHGEFLECLNAR